MLQCYSAPKGSDTDWLLLEGTLLARLERALDKVAGVTPLGSTDMAPGIMLVSGRTCWVAKKRQRWLVGVSSNRLVAVVLTP